MCIRDRTYGDLLAQYNKTWEDTYSLSVTAGGSYQKTKSSSLELIGWGDSQLSVNDEGVITSDA